MANETTQQDRWDRLAADIGAALGAENVRVDRRPYQQVHYGRLEQGVSSRIYLRHPQGGTVEVSDKYGRGGKWYGWSVDRIGADDICIGRPTYAVRNRSEIVAHVVRLMGV